MKLYISESPVFFYSHKIKVKSCKSCLRIGIEIPDCTKCEHIYQLQFSDDKRDLNDVLLKQQEGEYVTQKFLKWHLSKKTTYRKSRHKTIFDANYNPIGMIYGNQMYNFENAIKLRDPLRIQESNRGKGKRAKELESQEK